MLFLLATILMFGSLHAADLQGQIGHKNGLEISVSPGQTFEGVLRIWPYSNKSLKKFKLLEGKKITPYFFLHRISDLRLSSNNNEVVEIYGQFIVVTDFGITSFVMWEFDGAKIPITLMNVKVNSRETKNKEMHVVFQNVARDYSISLQAIVIALLGGACFLIIAGLYRKRYVNIRLQRKREQNAQLMWNKKLAAAQNREDYEEIYVNRTIWKEIMSIDPLHYEKFCLALEAHQYKKHWDDLAMAEVKDAHDKLIQERIT